MKCKVCDKEFPTLRALHCHLKAHKLPIATYYNDYAPKYDPYDGSKILYKTQKQFELQNFNSFENFCKWVDRFPPKDSLLVEFLWEKLHEYVSVKKITHAPTDLYLRLSLLPLKSHIETHIGPYKKVCEQLSLKPINIDPLPSSFWSSKIPEIEICIDTREQKPLSFKKSRSLKLDFGDYTTIQQFYSKTFIERKSASDFASTITHGFNRFEKELERCKRFNSYIFVLVESTVDSLEEELYGYAPNIGYIWHNTRQFLRKFPENLQIVFSKNRKGSEFLIPRILYFGQKLWNVDLQQKIEEKLCLGKQEYKNPV